jgi:signal transduction histidine kinase
MIELLIADNGPGFTPALLPHLFEPLHDRCNDDRGGEAVGMGLGLSICRWMIAAHGGQIDAFNQPGGGACIRLTLPTPVTAGGHGEMHIRTENGAA